MRARRGNPSRAERFAGSAYVRATAATASLITAATWSGTSTGRKKGLPGIVTTLTVAQASSVRRSASVSPPSPPSSACTTHVGTPLLHSIEAWSSPVLSHFRYSASPLRKALVSFLPKSAASSACRCGGSGSFFTIEPTPFFISAKGQVPTTLDSRTTLRKNADSSGSDKLIPSSTVGPTNSPFSAISKATLAPMLNPTTTSAPVSATSSAVRRPYASRL